MMRKVLISVLFLSLAFSAFAQDSDDDLFGSSDDDIFGTEDSMIEDIGDPEEAVNEIDDSFSDFLQSDQVEIGGNIRSSLSSFWSWSNGFPNTWTEFSEDFTDQLAIDLSGSLYVNARPTSDLRVFMKARTSYPFSNTVTVGSESVEEVNLQIFEFFSDVNWEDRIFFRFGKQTVNWGVGYYWSPADIISLVPIDLDDPEAEREGPIAIKATAPFDLSSFDAYVIGDTSVQKLEDLGLAGRATAFFYPLEASIGLGYQKDRPLRIVSTLRYPWRDWNFFAEGRVSFGRADQKLVDNGFFVELQDDDSTYYSGTAGFLYLKSDLFESTVDLNATFQYYYNGEGYADVELLDDAYGYLQAGENVFETVQNFGQHYIAGSLGLSQIFIDDLSFSSFGQLNLSDLSGLLSTSLSYQFFDGLSMTGSLYFGFGDDPSEYGGVGAFPSFKNPYGEFAAGLSLRLGGGQF
jgi:hypothetical protein